MRVALILILFATAVPCLGCSFDSATDADLFARSNSVFRARITEVKLVKSLASLQERSSRDVIEARFDVLEVLKGAPPASGVVRDLVSNGANCSLGLLPGFEYVLFPMKDDFVLAPSGSFQVAKHDFAVRKLESLRGLAAKTTR